MRNGWVNVNIDLMRTLTTIILQDDGISISQRCTNENSVRYLNEMMDLAGDDVPVVVASMSGHGYGDYGYLSTCICSENAIFPGAMMPCPPLFAVSGWNERDRTMAIFNNPFEPDVLRILENGQYYANYILRYPGDACPSVGPYQEVDGLSYLMVDTEEWTRLVRNLAGVYEPWSFRH